MSNIMSALFSGAKNIGDLAFFLQVILSTNAGIKTGIFSIFRVKTELFWQEKKQLFFYDAKTICSPYTYLWRVPKYFLRGEGPYF
jgi:hypothetical protein